MKHLMERMRALASEKGLTSQEFEKRFGLAVGSVDELAGTLSSDKIVHILEEYNDISAEWLMRGVGDMHITSNSDGISIGRDGVGAGSNVRDVSITNGPSESHINRIREGYLSMMGAKDEQIANLMRLIDKLTD
ncbi:hypothetical protein [uncultured Porphyromonas sp.]|uniref:hypothetical protein n=1 Tax=uncultured Porphyromonas sp. TaxID=159274 RepID=UPI0026186D14|nr:hypothetical protein [uncultured Porphyromonas sp.]